MVKFLFGTIGIIIAAFIGLLPEIVMYNIYGLIDPSTILEKIMVLGIFCIGGSALCLLFAMLGFMLWAAVMSAVLE